MELSEKGKTLLAKFEGKFPTVYFDVAGFQTIGIGHLLTKSELTSGKIKIFDNNVKYEDGLTENQMNDLLILDIAMTVHVVNSLVTVKLSQNQFDALVIFAFNVGCDAFKNSTLLKVLNEENYDEVPKQMLRWVHTNGKKIIGLQNRRLEEVKLWNSY